MKKASNTGFSPLMIKVEEQEDGSITITEFDFVNKKKRVYSGVRKKSGKKIRGFDEFTIEKDKLITEEDIL